MRLGGGGDGIISGVMECSSLLVEALLLSGSRRSVLLLLLCGFKLWA